MEEDLLASLLLWLHISGVIVFSIGLVGSFLISIFTAREEEYSVIQGLVKLGKIFSRWINLGGLVLLIGGFSVAGREKVPMFGFLQGSTTNWLLVSLLLLLSTAPVFFLIYFPCEKKINQEMKKAEVNGKVTPELKKALGDKTLRFGHLYEIAVYAAVVFLMTVKPF